MYPCYLVPGESLNAWSVFLCCQSQQGTAENMGKVAISDKSAKVSLHRQELLASANIVCVADIWIQTTQTILPRFVVMMYFHPKFYNLLKGSLLKKLNKSWDFVPTRGERVWPNPNFLKPKPQPYKTVILFPQATIKSIFSEFCKKRNFSKMWVGGVADSQTWSKPLKKTQNHPENRLFLPKFHL